MKLTYHRLTLSLAILALVSVAAPAALTGQAPAASSAKRAIELADIIAWKTIGATALSNDGQWFAYRVAPQEGDAELFVRNVASGKQWTFDLGEAAAGPGAGDVQFSDDSKWIAFTKGPSRADALRLRRQRRPVVTAAVVLNLASGAKKEYPNILRIAFNGEAATHVALHRAPAQAAGPAGGGPAAAPGGRGGGAAAAPAAPSDRPRGTDLILRDLSSGADLNVGNVSEFQFTRDGKRLASVIDAADRVGNGVQLRTMATGMVAALDHDSANYERLAWTDEGDALSALKGKEDHALADRRYAVIGFTGFDRETPAKIEYDPGADSSFPEGMTISGNRAPQWTEGRDAIVFGIHEPRKRDTPAVPQGAGAAAEGDDASAPAPPAAGNDADERVDLVLWHWKDTRLQSQQRVQEHADRNFNYLAQYRLASKTFVRLADDEVRTVTLAPGHQYAIGFDDREYELMGNLSGQRFRDVYAIDMATGERRLAVKRARWYNSTSPDGQSILYYDNGHFHVQSLKTGQSRNITQRAPVRFINTENDTNVVEPPTQVIGWAKDGGSVLISDSWDIWRAPVEGGSVVNLTVNGRKDGIRYQQRFPLEPVTERADGIDLKMPQYFRVYGEWTKKGGIGRLDPGKPGLQMVTWGDASFSRLMKAEKADTLVYTRETAVEPADFYATGAAFGEPTRLTDMRPQVADFHWTSGVRLVDYVSDKGDTLQAALFLPANYEAGRAYPTLVNFYERMSQQANTFGNPSSNGFNRSVYTSNGYAVLIPDIAYKVNDPGMSAVWCMVPAVKAAIETGIVDAKKVGITGHSWGGYQTSHLITQTDIFAAAVAGAPLTNMVSMYSLIYKNTGGTNQAIFESSQGRFEGGYWDHWDAYYRNSPVFFAKNVKTPLMILHNDQDGAVDFTQGVEYFNTLRRLGKPVIMLEYTGENHGLRRPANQRDYTVRMKEFFDHYLKGAPAPEWMTSGVPRLKMDEHLKERKPATPPPARRTTDAQGDSVVRR